MHNSNYNNNNEINSLEYNNEFNNYLFIDILKIINTQKLHEKRINDIEKYMQQKLNYPILNINLLSTSLNIEKSNYKIIPSGLVNSNRVIKDGIVFFGLENVNFINDISFPISEITNTTYITNGSNNSDNIPQFYIFFNILDESYYIKDIKKGIIFEKINDYYEINDNILIHIGNSYLVVCFDNKKLVLILKVFNLISIREKNNKNEKIKSNEFKIHNNQNTVIIIGRNAINNNKNNNYCLNIDDLMLSRIQCCIIYNIKTNKLYIKDGEYENNNSSTNGTWIYILGPKKIENKFQFKANHSLFEINLSRNE